MTDLGSIWLSLALAATTYSVCALALGIRQKDEHLLATGTKSVYTATALLSLAVLSLTNALFTRDFQLEYVASYTSRDLPPSYTLSALWAGQQGSLLFYTWLLSIFASAVLLLHRRRQEPLLRYTSLVMAISQAFFLVLLIFVTNPFVRMDFAPADGLGMNPLLENYAMLWHPPLLYLGYAAFTVPFALAIGSLIGGHLEDNLLRRVRRWSLISWLCLGLGTLTGAHWAYVRLGRGSYWTWDAAENASLITWLLATALIHSLIVHERRSTMKPWIMALLVLTFGLCIFGTAITSSGIIGSVHAPSLSRIGSYLLPFLGFVLVSSFLLILARLSLLRAEKKWGDPISRQSSLLLAVVLLVAISMAVLVRTLSPMTSEVESALDPDFFNRSSAVALGAVVLLMGVCPFIRWQGSTARNLMRDLLIPFVSTLVVLISLILLGLRDLIAILAFSVCAFVVVGTLLQFYKGLRDRRRPAEESRLSAFVSPMRRQRRRHRGYVVHLGIIFVVVGATGSRAYRVEEKATLEQGTLLAIGDYYLRYDDFAFYPTQGKDVAAATLTILRGESQVDVLVPERHFHHRAQQFVSEAAIHTTLKEDLYVSLIDWEGADSTIILQVIIGPLVVWMWIGGAILALGTVLAIWPTRREEDLEKRTEEKIMRLRQVGRKATRGETSQ